MWGRYIWAAIASAIGIYSYALGGWWILLGIICIAEGFSSLLKALAESIVTTKSQGNK